MTTKPSRLNRRRALAAGAASLSALALAACGESPTESAAGSLPEGLQAELQRNLERARAEARNVTQAAPRAAVNLPAPGAGHPVTVAMYPSNRVGGSLFGQFVNGLAAARERAEERYTYKEAALDYGRNASTFSISTSLDAVVNANPDLVIFFRADQADLLANDRLAPLDDFLVSDPDFDSADFWPGLLETGRHEGLRYAVPVAVSPHVLLFNRKLATELQVEPPLADPLAFDAEVFLDTVRRLHMEPPPSGGLGQHGLHIAVYAGTECQRRLLGIAIAIRAAAVGRRRHARARQRLRASHLAASHSRRRVPACLGARPPPCHHRWQQHPLISTYGPVRLHGQHPGVSPAQPAHRL